MHELHTVHMRARRTPHAPSASASVSSSLHPRCGATFSLPVPSSRTSPSASAPVVARKTFITRRRGSSRRAGTRRRDAHGRDRRYRRVLRPATRAASPARPAIAARLLSSTPASALPIGPRRPSASSPT
jgi:hypothetical protein